MSYQKEMIALMEESFVEGVESRNSACEQQIAELEARHKAEIEKLDKEHSDELMLEYQRGVEDTLKSVDVKPSSEEQAEGDGMPVHNVEPPSTRLYLDEIETFAQKGYGPNDNSRIWPYSSCVQSSSKRYSVTEMGWPYCIHGTGEKVVVECDDEPAQTITPYKKRFSVYALTPGKTYTWKMYSSTGKVIKSGSFRTVGRMRWMGTKDTVYPNNFRDVGATWPGGSMRFGRIYRSKNPDDIVAESADHKFLRDHLNITVQLNLRDGSKAGDAARSDMFEKTYSYDIPAYATVLTSSVKGRWKSAFAAVLKELQAGRNILINCEAGADRTGSFCWWLQALCHMPAGFLEAHWEATTYQRDQNSMIWDETYTEEKLRGMVAKFKAKWGDDPYEQAIGLAKLVGVSLDDVHEFQKVMIP